LILNSLDEPVRKLAKKANSKIVFFDGLNSAAAAVAVARIFKIPDKDIKKVLSGFKGVPYRQELVAVENGVKYINDTAATTPQSTILAIDTFKRKFPKSKIILIAGGEDKGLNYRDLAFKIKKEVDFLVLLPGSASEKIKRSLGAFDNIYLAKSMRLAVKTASKATQKDDLVLLSPGAASFNLFQNEFDRGRQFVKSIKQ
jgi:UDP-N-acetylmuramoylalanine--D-glutamate ligase